MTEEKKIAAITTAVNAYLEIEAKSTASTPPRTPVSLWKASGRQEIMQMSGLWQRRIVPLR